MTRAELKAAPDYAIQREIAGILGWKRGEYEEDDATMGCRWFAPGSPIPYRELPRWHDSLDACVELWRFAGIKRFRCEVRANLEVLEDGVCDQMLHTPRHHCEAFILAAKKEGF